MLYISDFREGDQVSDIYLCKNKVNAKTKNGKSYYSLQLQDKTGTCDGKVWDLSSGIDDFDAMDYIQIVAEVTVYQGQNQLNIRRIRKAREGEYDQADYLPSTKYNIDEMFKKLLNFVSSVKNEYLHALLEEFFVNDVKLSTEFRIHSAAKMVHHNFVGGLLQHSLRVAEICDFYAQRYSQINRDLLITGALLHDIGKLKEISDFPQNDYTDEGQLIGHIVMGTHMISEKAKNIEGFPEKLLLELNHMILSHHGELEYGSPKRPAFIEAIALHLADDTDAKLECMSALLENSPESEEWLGYNKIWQQNVKRTTGI